MPPEPIRSIADAEVKFKSDPEPVAADEVEIYENWVRIINRGDPEEYENWTPRDEVDTVHREGPTSGT